MEAVRSFPFVDYVFCGEGDLTVPEMTRRVVRNERSAELPFGVFDRAKAERGVPEVACVPGDAIAEPDSSDYYERIKGSRLHRAAVRKYFLESSLRLLERAEAALQFLRPQRGAGRLPAQRSRTGAGRTAPRLPGVRLPHLPDRRYGA